VVHFGCEPQRPGTTRVRCSSRKRTASQRRGPGPRSSVWGGFEFAWFVLERRKAGFPLGGGGARGGRSTATGAGGRGGRSGGLRWGDMLPEGGGGVWTRLLFRERGVRPGPTQREGGWCHFWVPGDPEMRVGKKNLL